MFAGHSIANSLSCGNTKAIVKDADSASNPFFTISISNGAVNKSYQFSIENDFINVSCDAKFDGSLVFVIRHFCGGSACNENNFGIIDVVSGVLLLEPDDRYKGNVQKANAIMGKEIKPSGWRENNQEIYLRSAIELG